MSFITGNVHPASEFEKTVHDYASNIKATATIWLVEAPTTIIIWSPVDPIKYIVPIPVQSKPNKRGIRNAEDKVVLSLRVNGHQLRVYCAAVQECLIVIHGYWRSIITASFPKFECFVADTFMFMLQLWWAAMRRFRLRWSEKVVNLQE